MGARRRRNHQAALLAERAQVLGDVESSTDQTERRKESIQLPTAVLFAIGLFWAVSLWMLIAHTLRS